MELNHINLAVPDVAETREFLETHFGFRCAVEKDPDTFVALRDDAGMSIAISNLEHTDAVTYPPAFHIGFRLGDDDDVDELHRRLRAAGVSVGRRQDFHGAWVFYFTAPGGFTIEVSHQHVRPGAGATGSEEPAAGTGPS